MRQHPGRRKRAVRREWCERIAEDIASLQDAIALTAVALTQYAQGDGWKTAAAMAAAWRVKPAGTGCPT